MFLSWWRWRRSCSLPAWWPLGATRTPHTVTFTADSLLGKPTNNSITVNIVPAAAIQYYYEYGTTDGGPYAGQSSTVDATGGQPSELTITGLSANTKYYYRLVYDGDGSVTDGDVERGTQHSFHTARAGGLDLLLLRHLRRTRREHPECLYATS